MHSRLFKEKKCTYRFVPFFNRRNRSESMLENVLVGNTWDTVPLIGWDD